jgi:hypothetical protein
MVAAILGSAHLASSVPPVNASYCWSDRMLGTQVHLTVDLRLKSGHENRRPNAADSAAVISNGGRILRSFQVAFLRVALDTTTLRALIAGGSGIADFAFPVSDTTRLDVRTQVILNRPPNPGDTSAIAALGGKDFFMYRPHHRTLSFMLPDSMIPRIRTLNGVSIVRALSLACIVTAGSDR